MFRCRKNHIGVRYVPVANRAYLVGTLFDTFFDIPGSSKQTENREEKTR